MGTSYTRQASTNITNGNIIDAADLNNEFNAIEDAFDATTGHAHNGTDSSYIEETGPTGQYSFTSSAMLPDGNLDIGATGNKFQNAYFSGDVDTATVTTSGLADLNSVSINSSTTITSIDTDLSSVSASHDTLASALAIKTYIDDEVTAQDLDITDGTNTTAIDLDSETLTVTGSTGISATVSDNTITISTTDSEILHDSLSGFVAAEHVDHSGVSITAGTGLSGGGTIEATRSLSLSHLGLESLSDPNADRVAFWDDSAGAFKWLTMGSNLAISGTTLNIDTSSDVTFAGLTLTGDITKNNPLVINTRDKATFKKETYVGDDNQYRLEIYNTDNATVDTTEVSLNLQMKTSNGTTVGNYGRLIATPKQTTTAAHDALLKLQAAYDGSLVDIVSFNGGNGNLDIGSSKGDITLNAELLNNDILLRTDNTYIGKSGETIRIQTDDGSQKIISTDTLTVQANTGNLDLVATGTNNIVMKNSDTTKVTFDLGDDKFTTASGYTFDINGDINLNASGNNVIMKGFGTGNLNFGVASSQSITSSGSMTLTATSGSVTITAPNGNNDITLHADRNVLIEGDEVRLINPNDTTNGYFHIDLDDSGQTISTGQGLKIKPAAYLALYSGAANSITFYKQTNSWASLLFDTDGDVHFAVAQNTGDAYLRSRYSGSTREVFLDGQYLKFRALTDNQYDLGDANYRWDDIYATNSTIQTSDANAKQDVVAISEAETRVAQALKGLLRKYRWITSVEEKGDAARYHFGIIAQDVKQAFEDEGLDPFDYAMLIKNVSWLKEVQDSEGNVKTKTYATQEEAPEGAVETTTWGVRYTELLAFIIAGL